MISKSIRLFLISALCLMLCGCGSKTVISTETGEEISIPKSVEFAAGEFCTDVTELTVALEAGELEKLRYFTVLERADFTGSAELEAIHAWALENPQVEVLYSVTLPDGTVLDTAAKKADLSAMSGENVRKAAECLALLPELKSIELGTEREGLSWEDIDVLQQACPDAKVKYYFELYDKEFDLQNTQLNLRHVRVYDAEEGCTLLRQAIDRMPYLTYVDLDSASVSNEQMEKLIADYPDIKFVWRIWFGGERVYSVRTDVEMILASKPSVGGFITESNGADLKYCTEVKYLDLGHNATLQDISFVEYMPNLEVLILAMAKWSDASPLAKCEKLEYLEIQTTNCTDLTPLSGLKNLRHLNLGCIPALEDISPLYELTELERLWLGSYHSVPDEQVEEMQRRAPNCKINTNTFDDPTGDGWRYGYHPDGYMYSDPRYILLRLQFDDYKGSAYSFYWNDPLYYP